jgi:MFS family permease
LALARLRFSGTISATSSEVGPFLTVEQAILPQTAPDERRTWLFSIYDMLGNFAGAAGALFAGTIGFWAAIGFGGAAAYRPLFVVYALIGLLNMVLFQGLSDSVELARVEGRANSSASTAHARRWPSFPSFSAWTRSLVAWSSSRWWRTGSTCAGVCLPKRSRSSSCG